MVNKAIALIKASGATIVGIVIAGFILDELGTKGRLGKTAQEVAKKVTRGFGQ